MYLATHLAGTILNAYLIEIVAWQAFKKYSCCIFVLHPALLLVIPVHLLFAATLPCYT